MAIELTPDPEPPQVPNYAPPAPLVSQGKRLLEARIAYDRIGHLYDEHYLASRRQRAFAGVVRDLLMENGLAPQDTPQPVLDLGCGTGSLLSLPGCLIDPVFYTGIDVAPGMLAAAREKYPLHRFTLADMSYLRRLKGRYARVISLGGAFNYVLNPKQTVAEMHHMMPLSGRFFFVVASARTVARQAKGKQPLARLVRELNAEIPQLGYTAAELQQLFTPFFSEVQVMGISGPSRWMPGFLPRAMHQLALDVEARSLGASRPDWFDWLVVMGRKWH